MFSTIVSYVDLANAHMLDLSLVRGFKKLHLYEIQLNMNDALAARIIELIHSII